MKKFRSLFLLWSAVSILSADTVVMKNGDKLSGTVVDTTEKGVIFKSELAGDVTIEWSNISDISTANPIIMTLQDGNKVTATIKTEGDHLVATPESGAPVEVPKTNVTAVRSQAAQLKFEELEHRRLHPGFLDLYTGFYDFGAAFARGNAVTNSFSSAAKLNRITEKDNFGLYFTQIYTSNSTVPPGGVTAQAVRGGWNYSRNVSKKWFLQGFNDYEFDRFQDLDLRTVVGGGLGYYFFKNDNGFLSISGGGSWNREQFGTGLLRNSSELYMAQEWNQKLNKVFTVTEKLVIFPNMSNGGAYRINFDTTLAASLNKLFALQFAVSDRYLSTPLVGRKKNDILFTSGIRFTIPTREK